jgi:hypothetical protein
MPMRNHSHKKPVLKYCYGIASQVGGKIPIKPEDPHQEQSHVVFFDYDVEDRETFTTWLRYVQDIYHLSDIYLIKSTTGFNALSLDIMSIPEIKRIGTDILSPCDRKFFSLNSERGYYTLRMDGGEKHLTEILYAEGRYPKSRAHKNFLEWFFEIKIIDDIWFDNGEWPAIIKYASAKNGYHYEVLR